MVWTRLPFIRSGQNHLARNSERGKKTRQTEEVVEFAMSQRAVENRKKIEETSFKVICGAPTTLTVKGWVKVKKEHVVLRAKKKNG